MQGPPSGRSAVNDLERARAEADEAREPRARVGTVELARWLHQRAERIADLWGHEVRARDLGAADATARVINLFARGVLDMLPVMVGPYREQIQRHWDRTAQLYGTVAARRGLAAGEAIDEWHILRELVIRELYRDPPEECEGPLALREFLRLNRSLDRAVSHVSVGHTDALFFQFFEDEAAESANHAEADIALETAAQLREIRDEVDGILSQAPWSVTRGPREH